MPLVDVPLPITVIPPSADVRRFLDEADRRIDDFQREGRIYGFITGDYAGAYLILRELAGSVLIRGTRFCEWGSGFGVIASLAAMAGFESYGIEIEPRLVEAAQALSDEFELPVEHACGSYVPRGGESRVHAAGEHSWLATEGDFAYEELGIDMEDLDVIYVYPWPDEEVATADLFEHFAGPGALLLSFHGDNGFRLRRKMRKKTGRR